MPDDHETERIKLGAKLALAAAVNHDLKGLDAAFDLLPDTESLWIAAHAWSRVIEKCSGLKLGGGDYLGVSFGHGGKIVNPEELPTDFAPAVWAARFLAGAIGRDYLTCRGLFEGASDDDLSDGLTSLLQLAAQHVERYGLEPS